MERDARGDKRRRSPNAAIFADEQPSPQARIRQSFSKATASTMDLLSASAAASEQQQQRRKHLALLPRSQDSPRNRELLSDADIGVALGSPSQVSFAAPQRGSPGIPSALAPPRPPRPGMALSPDGRPVPEGGVKQTPRPKGLGGFLGKLSARGPAAALTPAGYPQRRRSNGFGRNSTGQPLDGTAERSEAIFTLRRASSKSLDAVAVPAGKGKPKNERRQTGHAKRLPSLEAPRRDPARGQRSPTPPPKDPRYLAYGPRSSSLSKSLSKPLLQVDIPDASMERYSVMFRGVLDLRQSSLLARRQAQLDKLVLPDNEGKSGEVCTQPGGGRDDNNTERRLTGGPGTERRRQGTKASAAEDDGSLSL
jgi:hypothetical protein